MAAAIAVTATGARASAVALATAVKDGKLIGVQNFVIHRSLLLFDEEEISSIMTRPLRTRESDSLMDITSGETALRNRRRRKACRSAGVLGRVACCLARRAYTVPMAVSSPELKAFLLATPFFGGLTDASLDLLISMLVERSFAAGETVVAEGEPGRSLFVVHSGQLAVNKQTESGQSFRMSNLEPGDFFGEMTLIEMQNRSATVVVETPTVLYELTAQNLYACYKADIHAYVIVMQNISRELCRRLRRADDRFAKSLMLKAEK